MSWHVLCSFVIYIGNVYNSSVGIMKNLMDFYTALIMCLMLSSPYILFPWRNLCCRPLSFYLFLAEVVTELLQVKIPFLFLHISSHFDNNSKKIIHWTFEFTNILGEAPASPSEGEDSAFHQNVDNFLPDCTVLDCRMPFTS